jgi:hypothetical protein
VVIFALGLVVYALPGRPSSIPVMLLPAFVGLGLYVTIAGVTLSVVRRRRHAAVYGLTDNSILIVAQRSMRSLPLQTLADFSLAEGRDGRGTITLGPPVNNLQAPPALEMIPDARSVYRLIQEGRARSPVIPSTASGQEHSG